MTNNLKKTPLGKFISTYIISNMDISLTQKGILISLMATDLTTQQLIDMNPLTSRNKIKESIRGLRSEGYIILTNSGAKNKESGKNVWKINPELP